MAESSGKSQTLSPEQAGVQIDLVSPSNSTFEIIKKPPPERPQNARTRSWVVVSFWSVIVFLGLPVWLWTTSIHRATLPLQEMQDWADGKVRDALKLYF